MNIREAKDQIKNAITAYLIKDEFCDYKISIEHQRPIFLLGAPGIGKTAIMEQIAQETGLNLISYSMAHQTRESAMGLPNIVTRNWWGEKQVAKFCRCSGRTVLSSWQCFATAVTQFSYRNGRTLPPQWQNDAPKEGIGASLAHSLAHKSILY